MKAKVMVCALVGACSGSVTVDGDTDAPIDTSGPLEPADPSVDGGDDRPDPLPSLPCHAWDPLDVSGGSRTYALTAGDDVSTETHSLGVTIDLPQVPDGNWGVRVVSDADPSTDVVIINGCRDADAPGAYETAFQGRVAGVDLAALAQQGIRYLPTDVALDNRRRPSWTSETAWALDAHVDVPGCPDPLPLRRSTSASFEVQGRESITVPALGEVEAVRIELQQTERVDARGNLSTPCKSALERFDVIGPTTRTEVRSVRWYVRGVGLALALVVDPDDAACATLDGGVVPEGCTPALERRLTACSGLASCP